MGQHAHELLALASAAAAIAEPGKGPLETGYTTPPRGEIRVFCLTHMFQL